MAYSQLIRDERFYMEKRLFSGESISKRKLAKELGRSHSTVIRENEHQNGLIRDFMSKKTDFRLYDDIAFREVENNLNNRPRKSLNYLTPVEAITNYIQTGDMGVQYVR